MAGYNQFEIIGNLTRDPELKYSKSGVPVCDVTVAANEKTKAGESTLFLDITLFNRDAEVCCEYLTKGSQVFIRGRLKLDQWTGNDGQKRSKVAGICDRLIMLGTRSGNHSDNGRSEPNPDASNDDNPF